MREYIQDFTNGISKISLFYNHTTGYYEAEHEYNGKPTLWGVDIYRITKRINMRGFF